MYVLLMHRMSELRWCLYLLLKPVHLDLPVLDLLLEGLDHGQVVQCDVVVVVLDVIEGLL